MVEQLTAERARQVLQYNPETGDMLRLEHAGNAGKGSLAGSRNSSGYLSIMIDGKLYVSHRLAWLCMTGQWPSGQVDHINGNRNDNRWINLRDVSGQANSQNRRAPNPSNVSGLLGVGFRPSAKKKRFTARILINGRCVHLGAFESAELAHQAYLAAKIANHPGYAP